MIVADYRRTLSQKIVRVENCAGYTRDEVLDFAMQHTGEARQSLFGWHVTPTAYGYEVTLNTD